ncbi:hypothetical protein HPB48_009989 [Haemaphysalis longicornis]|uniref:Uncharacterized protein n=1 Tax=Haemaphysalis longicornis TaxID=44386 RepID=A0A9J6FWH7_HAELO|nr:hypothetical protein HPB48_009989 [Haemaphysalis longicornis]
MHFLGRFIGSPLVSGSSPKCASSLRNNNAPMGINAPRCGRRAAGSFLPSGLAARALFLARPAPASLVAVCDVCRARQFQRKECHPAYNKCEARLAQSIRLSGPPLAASPFPSFDSDKEPRSAAPIRRELDGPQGKARLGTNVGSQRTPSAGGERNKKPVVEEQFRRTQLALWAVQRTQLKEGAKAREGLGLAAGALTLLLPPTKRRRQHNSTDRSGVKAFLEPTSRVFCFLLLPPPNGKSSAMCSG